VLLTFCIPAIRRRPTKYDHGLQCPDNRKHTVGRRKGSVCSDRTNGRKAGPGGAELDDRSLCRQSMNARLDGRLGRHCRQPARALAANNTGTQAHTETVVEKSRSRLAAQLDAEAVTARLRSGAEAPGPNTSVAASRRLQNNRREPEIAARQPPRRKGINTWALAVQLSAYAVGRT
jgi:hypothetical protein